MSLSAAPLQLVPPTHVVVRHADARISNLAGYALIGSLAEEFVLLEMRPGPGSPAAEEIPWAAAFPPERHLITFAPGPGAPSTGDPEPWPIVRSDASDRVVSHLPQFLARPEASEQSFRQSLPSKRPLPILIANGWMAARYFPDDPESTGRLMAVQKQFGISVILSADETPRRDYGAFDYLFDIVRAASNEGSFRFRCAKAPPRAPLLSGDEFTLDLAAQSVDLPGPPLASGTAASTTPPTGRA